MGSSALLSAMESRTPSNSGKIYLFPKLSDSKAKILFFSSKSKALIAFQFSPNG
jgi:hypothetical protein